MAVLYIKPGDEVRNHRLGHSEVCCYIGAAGRLMDIRFFGRTVQLVESGTNQNFSAKIGADEAGVYYQQAFYIPLEDDVEVVEAETASPRSVFIILRHCPVCGQMITISGCTGDQRLIGSCGDAFTRAAWES